MRTRGGEEVELENYRRLQQDGRLQPAGVERVVCGLSTRNYHRAVRKELSTGQDRSCTPVPFLKRKGHPTGPLIPCEEQISIATFFVSIIVFSCNDPSWMAIEHLGVV